MRLLVEGLLWIIRYWWVLICHKCRDKWETHKKLLFLSCVLPFSFSFSALPLFNSLYFQHLCPNPNPLCVFHSRSFLLQAHTLSFSLSRSQTTQTAVPVCSSCSPAVARVCVTLFPHGYDWGSPRRDPSNPISFSLAPFFPVSFSSLCSCPQRIGEGWLLCPVQVSRVGEKGRRGCGCLLSGGEVIQPGIPHLWQVLTHMSQPVTPGL